MDHFSGWCRSERRLDGQTAIITGANGGIGKETAYEFYVRGARVIMACRDVKRGEIAKRELTERAIQTSNQRPGDFLVDELDLASVKSIKKFAKLMLEREPKISILVNNAGVMMCPESKTEDGFETHIGSNHLGHVLLTLLLLPRMKKSAPSRIVCVSSYLHGDYEIDLDDLNFERTKYDPLKAYSYSKSANILFAKSLASKLKERGIHDVTTYSLHPGVIRTNIGRHFSTTYMKGATWIFNNLFRVFLKSPKCGAQTQIYCSVAEECANESGLYYSDCAVKQPAKHCQSDENASELWAKSIKLLNLENYDPFGDKDPQGVL